MLSYINKIKNALYKRCSAGEISVNQREALLQKVNEKYYEDYLLEKAYEVEDDTPVKRSYGEDASYVYESVRNEVYKRWANGEINLEEREELLNRARDEILA